MSGRAIRAVAAIGKGAIGTGPRPAGSALFSEQAWIAIGRSLRLSGRELQVVRGAFDDQIELVIADHLGIGSRTVHTHIERLYRKLGIKDRTQLLVRVMREFLTLTASPDHGLPPVCGNRTVGSCPLQT
jgi:DNA-binding NarL/FixJ family response regulator